MPFIDNTPALSTYKVKEGTLQDDFVNLLVQHGWRKVLEFKKFVTSVHFVTEHDETSLHDDKFAVANHQIVSNARGDLLGIAIVSSWDDYTAHDQGFPFYNWFTSTEEDKDSLISYMEGEFENRKTGTVMYFYMIDKLPNIQEGDKVFTPWGLESEPDKILQMSLDVEVTAIDFQSTNAGSEHVKDANPSVMQSPVVESVLRSEFLDNVDYPYMNTNWWDDSEVSIRGSLDSNNIFVVLQSDNTTMWEDNVIPLVPLYFGDIVPMDDGDPAIAMFAGTVPQGSDSTSVATYDFNDETVEGGKRILPILKKYPSNPSNGVDSVIINRSKLGARYQSYYLSWNTAPNELPPSRESGEGKQYPRSYDNQNYQFNPSRYSGKVQTSRVYLIHPEEGVRGHLKSSVGLNSANLNASELRIRQEDCPEKIYDVYQCIPVSAVSPLTKRPATHFRPMGLGLFKEELNVTNPTPSNTGDSTPPNEVTNLSGESPKGGYVSLSWVNPEDADFYGVDILVDSEKVATGVVGVDNYVLSGLSTGTTTITVISKDTSGNESSGVTVTVEVK